MLEAAAAATLLFFVNFEHSFTPNDFEYFYECFSNVEAGSRRLLPASAWFLQNATRRTFLWGEINEILIKCTNNRIMLRTDCVSEHILRNSAILTSFKFNAGLHMYCKKYSSSKSLTFTKWHSLADSDNHTLQIQEENSLP